MSLAVWREHLIRKPTHNHHICLCTAVYTYMHFILLAQGWFSSGVGGSVLLCSDVAESALQAGPVSLPRSLTTL